MFTNNHFGNQGYRFYQFSVLHERSFVLDVIGGQPGLYLVSQSLEIEIQPGTPQNTNQIDSAMGTSLTYLQLFNLFLQVCLILFFLVGIGGTVHLVVS